MGAPILSYLGCYTNELYLETELRHGTEEWDILCQGFFIMFNFEDRFESIDEMLQEVKEKIFRIPQDPLDLIQLDWTT